MQRLVLLTDLYFPEETSTGYFLTKIAEGLVNEYKVTVITGPATQSFLHCQGWPNYEVRNRVEILRCSGTSFDKNFLLGRVFNLGTRSLSILLKALFVCQKEDLVLVVTNPPLLPFAALLLNLLKGCEFVLIIHDIYPEILVATGLCQPSSFVVKVGQLINRVLYNRSSRIVTLGRDMTRLAKAKLSQDNGKIHCIPHWADCDIIRPTDRAKNELLKELGLTEYFVVLYAGNMGRTHGIEYVAEAAQRLKRNKNIRFIISGFGAKQKWIEEYVNSNQLENIHVLHPCSRSDLIVLLNACDVAIIPFLPGMAGVSVPSRMYNQIAAGKAIIAVTDDWSELAEVVREEKIGWVVQPGDITGLVKTIQLATQNTELCIKMGSKGAVVAQTKYTLAQTDQAYKKLLKELLATF